jgi:hypothetical protein
MLLGVTPRIKMHHSDPSVDRRIIVFRQLKQVFEPYRMMLKELKGETEASSITTYLQRKGKQKYGGEGANVEFSLFTGDLVTTRPQKVRNGCAGVYD